MIDRKNFYILFKKALTNICLVWYVVAGDDMKKTINEIILFENQKVKLEVNMSDETVWLTQKQMAKLFGKDRRTITRHIQNIFKDHELEETSVCSFFEHTAEDGKKYRVQYYNLDMIISVGYRVNSKQGIIFRKWATKVLKDYMIKGYAVNQKRLEYLEKTIRLIDIANRIDDELENDQAREILRVIGDYSKALSLLDDYDHRTLKNIRGTKDQRKITYEDCMKLIKKLRFNEESDLFAIERNNGLASIINNIYQTFDGKEVYQSVEEKAVNFLYLIVKDHIFIDGNKRIAATLFIYFLNFYQILYKGDKQLIDNNTLTALTLLIAQSNPKEKDILVDLVMNFLN